MPSSKGQTPSASESGDGNIRTESHLNDQKAPAEATEAKGDIEGLEIPAQLTDRKETILRRTGYTVSYNEDLLIPNWVAWHLTSDRLTGPAKRKGIPFMRTRRPPEYSSTPTTTPGRVSTAATCVPQATTNGASRR